MKKSLYINHKNNPRSKCYPNYNPNANSKSHFSPYYNLVGSLGCLFITKAKNEKILPTSVRKCQKILSHLPTSFRVGQGDNQENVKPPYHLCFRLIHPSYLKEQIVFWGYPYRKFLIFP